MPSRVIPCALLCASLLAAANAAAGSITIGATTYATPGNLGSFAAGAQLALGDAVVNNSTTGALTFFDDFVFTVSAPVNLTSLSASIQELPLASIGSFAERLYSGGTAVYQATGANPLTGTALASGSSTSSLTYSNLAAGTYTLQVSGIIPMASSVLGVVVPGAGSYGTLVAISAVPEPSTYALWALGLAAVAALGGRRRNVARAVA